MKRDVELVRKILINAENSNGFYNAFQLASDKEEMQKVGYHVDILIDAGYVEGTVEQAMGGNYVFASISKLTWQGHDFLDAVRDDTVWNNTKKKAGSAFQSVSFGVIKSIAEGFMRAQLGL